MPISALKSCPIDMGEDTGEGCRLFLIALPDLRLSIFSVFRKVVHANAQLFARLGPKIEKIDSL